MGLQLLFTILTYNYLCHFSKLSICTATGGNGDPGFLQAFLELFLHNSYKKFFYHLSQFLLLISLSSTPFLSKHLSSLGQSLLISLDYFPKAQCLTYLTPRGSFRSLTLFLTVV